jgi:hypothetical protein
VQLQTNIAWRVSVEIPSSPVLLVASGTAVDAYDRIVLAVPNSTNTPTDEVTVDVQPGTADKVRLIAVTSASYGDDLRMKVHDTSSPEIALNDALFLVGQGAVEMLGAQPDKLLFLNSLGHDVTIEILVGRLAT